MYRIKVLGYCTWCRVNVGLVPRASRTEMEMGNGKQKIGNIIDMMIEIILEMDGFF